MTNHCDQCNKDFTSTEALNQHNKSKHPESYKEPKLSSEQKKKMRTWIILVVVLGLAVWGVYALLQKDKEADTGLTFEPPKGAIHWHPKLTIKIDGVVQAIPANIGIGAVHKPIHTHDEDAAQGVIHMEIDRPTKQNVVLGYFFEIWNKKFNKDCIFDYCTDKGTLTMKVNGKENLDLENYYMRDKDDIVIEYISNNVASK